MFDSWHALHMIQPPAVLAEFISDLPMSDYRDVWNWMERVLREAERVVKQEAAG
jgi:hypothetical protein